MTVQDAARAASVPQQAAPVDPPSAPAVAPAPAAPAPQIGRDRPRTSEERQFLLGGLALCLFLSIFIVTGLLLAELVWS